MLTLTPSLRVDREHRVGVVDIGSNSIRLVVFEGDRRMPIPIFNEKAMCRLGEDLRDTGRLSESGRLLSIANLSRFIELSGEMDLSRLDIVATAAVRDASNGPEFVSELEERFGRKIRILSGGEEARLSALGVISAFPDADGVVGDLGGGSLELVDIDCVVPRKTVSLPLGPLRLLELTGDNRAEQIHQIDRYLSTVDWIDRLRGRNFYAVGGVWRSIARAHMEEDEYPLQVIQGYTLRRRKVTAFCDLLSRFDSDSVAAMPGVARRRLETIPLGALLLSRLLRLGRPDQVIFSAFGLREGVLFDRLSPADKGQDPLLASCAEIASKSGRFPPIAKAAEFWVKGLFPDLSERDTRMLSVTAILSDLAWSEHPRYRGEHAFFKVLRLPVVGMTHPERVFVARAVYARYAGPAEVPDENLVRDMLDDTQCHVALLIGLTMRLAVTLSGGLAGILRKTEMRWYSDRVSIMYPADVEVVQGDVVQRRAEELGSALGKPVIFERMAVPFGQASDSAIA